jgi:putative peptidoglycan lipid II flippase
MPGKFSRLLNSRAESVVASAMVIGTASMLSRFLGVYRDRLLSGTFGAGHELDAYYAAFRFPDFFYNLFVLGALSAGFIPVMSELLAKERGSSPEAPSWLFVQRIVTVLSAIIGVASLLLAVAAPILVPLLTPGFSAVDTATAVTMTRIMALGGPLLAASSIMGSVLQSHRRFLAFAVAPVLYNIGIIAGVLALAPAIGVVGAAWGVVFGLAMHLFVQWWAARAAGFRFRWRWEPGDREVREVVRMAVPRTLSLGMNQLNLMILTGLATTVGVGALTVFNLANNLQSFPVSLIGISFAVASFPVIADLAATGRRDELIAEIGRLTRTVLFLVVPATVLFLLLRTELVRVILGNGRFGWEDTVATATAMACFVASLFAQALLPLVARVFFSLKDVVTPLVAGVVAIVVERLLSWWFIGPSFSLGAPGLALAFSIGSAVNLVWLWWRLRTRLGSLGERHLSAAVARMVAAGLVAAVVTEATRSIVGNAFRPQSLAGALAQLAAAGTIGTAAYLFAAHMLGLEEVSSVLGQLTRRLKRLARRREVTCTVSLDGLEGQPTGECTTPRTPGDNS